MTAVYPERGRRAALCSCPRPAPARPPFRARPRSSAADSAAPKVSHSETKLYRLTPVSGPFRPTFADPVSLASPTSNSTPLAPPPQPFTSGPSSAGPTALLASRLSPVAPHLPTPQRLRFADPKPLRVDRPSGVQVRTPRRGTRPHRNVRRACGIPRPGGLA